MKCDGNYLWIICCGAMLLDLSGCGGNSSNGVAPPPPAGHNEWTWESGASVINQPGTYGTQGTAAAPNAPGAREGAITWTDASGNFWMFGGIAQPTQASDSLLNDLWKYSGGQWTWMGGSSGYNQAGVYGTQGAPDPHNVPGARTNAVGWKDASGNLWLFGGLGLDVNGDSEYLNDLWKYSAGEWTWMGGPQVATLFLPGVYGVEGTAAPGNIPGGRSDAMAWTDSAGNFWLFGGQGSDSAGTLGGLNDLWEYSRGEWTWVGGSKLAGDPGSYGALGVASPTNSPRARWDVAAWVDANGNFWLFGGEFFQEPATGYAFNDMWKYSGGQWTWMGGSDQVDQAGTYGTMGVASAANVPGARGAATTWTDAAGNFWLFAGFGMTQATGCQFPNDLWKYSAGKWTWVGGPQVTGCSLGWGSYGALGVESAGNYPGSRLYGAGWTDSSGNLWLFGGDGADSNGVEGYLSDLWKYEP